MSALSSGDKLQLNVTYYAYWFYTVSVDILTTENGSAPSTTQLVGLSTARVADVEKICGDLPSDYSDALKAVAPLIEKDGTAYVLTSKVDFKDNDNAQKVLDTLFNNFVKLSADQIKFLDNFIAWESSNGGYYFAQTNLNSKGANTLGTVINLLYLEIQDTEADGADPTAFSASNYVEKTGSFFDSKYSWKSGVTAQNYIDDFNAYTEAYDKNVMQVSAKVIDKILAATDNMKGFEDLSKAVRAVAETGAKLYKGQDVSTEELQNASSLQANLSENSRRFYEKMASSYYCSVVTTVDNLYTNASTLTAANANSRPSKLNVYTLNYCLSQINTKLDVVLYNEFVEYLDKVDLSNVTDSIVKETKSKYNALTSTYKSKLTDAQNEKIRQIVTPIPDSNDFLQEIKDYKITDIVRPENSDIAWTEGGIQSSADGLWKLIGNVTNLIVPDLEIKDTGLDTVLKGNVYTNDMVSKIIDLYASLSKNSTDLGVMSLTLGDIVSKLCSPSNIESALQESKYSTAVDKMQDYMSNYDSNDGQNELEYLADLEFVSGDFGFEDGDRDGFVDALLAIIRPITTLLAPGTKVLNLVSLGINMFDYVDSRANYVNGVYSNLIPALEAMGLTDIPSEKDYKANYYNVVEKSGSTIAADEFLRPIVNAICTKYIDVVSPDVVNGLIKLLPGIGYTIGSNLLNDSVKAALSQAGLLSSLASSIDLTADGVNKMITAQPIVINGNNIQLQAIDWATLGNCATVSSVKSNSNSNAYLMLRTGDTDTCFTTVYYYVYDVFFADKDNLASLKNIIDTAITNSSAASIVNSIVNNIAYREKEDSYAQFLYVVGGEPTGAEIPGRPGTTDPSEPSTEPTQPSEPSTEPTQPTQPTQPTEPATQPTAPVTQPTAAPTTTKSNTAKLPKNYKKVGKDIVNTKQKKASFKKVKAQKKAIAFEWKKVSGVKGYQIQYTTDKKFKKNVKSTTITKQKTTKKTVKKLKGKKKYYVRIRTYKTQKINGKTVKVYSNWSKTKTVKTK